MLIFSSGFILKLEISKQNHALSVDSTRQWKN